MVQGDAKGSGGSCLKALLMGLLVSVVVGVGFTLLAWYLMDWMVVDVRAREDGGSRHLWLPFPVACARVAVAVAPEEAFEDMFSEEDVEEVSRLDWEELGVFIGELAACPDARLVEVRSSDGDVVIEKRGSWLLIEAYSGEGDRVSLKIPLKEMSKRARKFKKGKLSGKDLAKFILSVVDDGFEIDAADSDGDRVRIYVR